MGNNNKIKKQLVPVRDVHKEVALLLEDELSLISMLNRKKHIFLVRNILKHKRIIFLSCGRMSGQDS